MNDLFDPATTDLGHRSHWPKDYQAQFWELYPRRVSKAPAMKALDKIRADNLVTWERLVEAIEHYKIWLSQSGPGVWRPEAKYPATWLRAHCWEDELRMAEPPKPSFFQQVYGHHGRRDH